MKKIKSLIMLILVIGLTAGTALADMPKYVFFFLGDGMSSTQIQATEAYLTTLNGGSAILATDLQKDENRLNMSKMPVVGMQTTYDAHALMTDSASAGTAFACGIKTMSGVVGMDETQSISYKSIAQLAYEQGRKVGVISSVSLDHATPASYYASVPNRGFMNNIATQLAETDYDFFGGGGLASPTAASRVGDTSNNVWDVLTENGYSVLNDRDSIMALMTNPKDKVVCINPWLQDSSAMPYAIDRPNTNLSLKEITDVAISCLENNDDKLLFDGKHGKKRHCSKFRNNRNINGFFLMVEGGKIDWACHANDAVASIGDTLDFDNAIGSAIEFYNKHPRETLIVVTGDHETGGMTIGHATTGYSAHYDVLLGQMNSYTYFAQNQWPAHKAAYNEGYDWSRPDNFSSNGSMMDLLTSAFGLTWDELNSYQKEKLEDAYDKSMIGENDNSSDENKLLYGNYEPIIVTITHIMNENASIGWTSYSHTGVPVPVFAMGSDSELFSGFYDNTDIAKKLAKAMDIIEKLPVEK
ncbi:MAG: alkaline phosphatase [Proteobacteria bacterium]|nr:alkaline phosphatase [Pseudomonadota bacterium]